MLGRFSIIFPIFAALTPALVFAASINFSTSFLGHYHPEGIANCPKIISREEWGAKEPNCYESMKRPVKHVVIHHTYSPSACFDRHNCSMAMRSMQRFHQEDRKWCDIGYNFAVGGDGYVYVGRGWEGVGAHAPPYNRDSIGVTLIGDWNKVLPNEEMLNAVKALIKCGVNSGFIVKDYKLLGHRQGATATECPGEVLFQEIQKWPHWSNDWIHPPPTPKPEIRLIETNSASAVKCSSGEQNEETRYQVERLRRSRRMLGSVFSI